MTKLLTIDLRSTAPRMLGSRGTPSQFVLYGLKNMCAKFDAFTRFVTIFPLTDRTTVSRKRLPEQERIGRYNNEHQPLRNGSLQPARKQLLIPSFIGIEDVYTPVK